MTVNVSKPAINVREKLAELDKPTGIAGEAMLRAETPQEQFNLISAGRRNLIINGDFQVSQRGTSITGTGYFYGAADRWRSYGYSSNSTTLAVVDSGEILPDGSAISRYLSATSTSNRVFVTHRVENVAQFNKQTLTLSGWVKCPSGNACIGVDFEMGGALNYGSGGSTSESITGFVDGTKSGTVLSGEWQKFTKTITIPDISAKTFGSSNTSYLEFYLTSDSVSGTLHFANVQLELGKVATPFEHRSYGEELALCQRYFYRLNSGSAPYSITGVVGATDHIFTHWHPQEMRTSPTAENRTGTWSSYHVGTAGGGQTGPTSTNVSSMTFEPYSLGGRFYFTKQGTSGLICWVDITGSSGSVDFSAEL